MNLLLNKKRVCIFLALFFLFSPFAILKGESYETKLFAPAGGFTTGQTKVVKGSTHPDVRRGTVLVNGIPQDVPVNGGAFSVKVVVSPGMNIVELKTDHGSDRISFYAKVPKRDIKMVLTWDNARYVDLWVTDPKGERCYWAHPWTTSGGNLVANDETGFGPQIFTMQTAISGTYTIQVQYYSAGNAPITRVKLYIVLYEGTTREKTERYTFTMNKPNQIYHITDLVVSEEK